MGNRTVLSSFVGVLILITYRDFRQPDPNWPLGPVPPPYRFTYAGVVFGILALVSDIWSPKLASVVAVGVLIGTLYAVVSGQSAIAGLQANAPGYAKKGPAQAQQVANNQTGSTPVNGGTIQA